MAKYHPRKTAASRAFTDLIRASLRLGGESLRIGPLLTGDLNLTNARWLTLGELNDAEADGGGPVTVSQLSRRMGLARQSVQRLVDGMAGARLVRMADNPADARARHVRLTPAGRRLYARTQDREWRWTNDVSAAFDVTELRAAVATVEAVADRMAGEWADP